MSNTCLEYAVLCIENKITNFYLPFLKHKNKKACCLKLYGAVKDEVQNCFFSYSALLEVCANRPGISKVSEK